MRKTLTILIIAVMLGFTALSHANTVTIKLENVYNQGIKVSSLQMDFSTSYGFPFLSDDNDPFVPEDFSTEKGDAITWNSNVSSHWYLEALESYDDATGIASARGIVAYSDLDNDLLALHDGSIAILSSEHTVFMVDLDTIQLFDFIDTANPIPNLTFTENISGNDQTVIIRGTVPIPAAAWLLGSGLLGLLGLRRRRT